MALDHSATYRHFSLKNINHFARIRDIKKTLVRMSSGDVVMRYADYGCSNGYLTELSSKILDANATVGFDHNEENLRIARSKYPTLEFLSMDLNSGELLHDQFDFVTCYETLEHIGDIENALKILVGSLSKGGKALVTVPIEIGAVGLLKFAVKMLVFRYSLDELSARKRVGWEYFLALVKGSNINEFRDERAHWGTHFGFDYREVDNQLEVMPIHVFAFNKGTTRFYEIIKV